MKTAVILASGAGTKVWPYAEIRSKVMIPVSNKPIVAHSVDTLISLGFDNIIIVGKPFIEELRSYFRDYRQVTIVEEASVHGTAFSLLCAKDYVKEDSFLALYGDTIITGNDLQALAQADGEMTALVERNRGFDGDYIGCTLTDGGDVEYIIGHSREDTTHHFCGFALPKEIFEALPYNSNRFTCTDVGMMSPIEGYLEMTLADEIKRGKGLRALSAKDRVFDIDRPWDILEANREVNSRLCGALTENELGEGATIDDSAHIGGFVRLGKNSHIGKNVLIKGNVIIGDNTEVFNGAILSENVVIGDNCSIRNYCYIDMCSTVGNNCVVSHCAELTGMIMNTVYLYHYMELFGVIGDNVDLGAATVCGSLRFDDFTTLHKVKGRRELSLGYGDATFIGDYCRTGVNTTIMPGTRIGVYSVIGAGVVLNKDVPNNTLIYCEQNLKEKHWGPEKYGW